MERNGVTVGHKPIRNTTSIFVNKMQRNYIVSQVMYIFNVVEIEVEEVISINSIHYFTQSIQITS